MTKPRKHGLPPGRPSSRPRRIRDPYRKLLSVLDGQAPLIVGHLASTDQRRGANLLRLTTNYPWALPGLELYFRHVRALSSAIDKGDRPEAAGLVLRILDDTEISVEAILGGSPALVSDSCRDIMEIEFLLYEFAASGSAIGEWASLPEHIRNQRFGFSAMRKKEEKRRRIADGLVLPDKFEYMAHCEQLHPTASGGLFGSKGNGHMSAEQSIEFGVTEVYRHSERALHATYRYLASLDDLSLDVPEAARSLDGYYDALMMAYPPLPSDGSGDDAYPYGRRPSDVKAFFAAIPPRRPKTRLMLADLPWNSTDEPTGTDV